MTIASTAVASFTPSYQSQPVAQRSGRDRDGDNDATESAATKAKEARSPVNPNLGNNLNIAA